MSELRTHSRGTEMASPRREGELRDPIAPRMEAVKR
jgi:hypothetical protein